MSHDLRALTPACPGGRSGPHLPGGGGRLRATRPVVLGWQGLGGDAARGGQGVLAGAAAVPGDARRHRPQPGRGHRIPGPHRGAAGGAPARGLACRTTSTPVGWPRRPAPGPAGTACRRSRCCGPSGSIVSTPCSGAPAATRRRPGPRSGCSASAMSSASGIPATSARSCGTSTTAGTAKASTSGCSRCPTGPSWTSGSTSSRRRSSCPRSTTPTAARSSSATACSWPSRRM